MRMVITGATGNLGTALLRRLAADAPDGRHEIVGIARRTPHGPRVAGHGLLCAVAGHHPGAYRAGLDAHGRCQGCFGEAIEGMRDEAGTASPVLRPRSMLVQLKKLASSGPISSRRLS